MTWHDMTRHYTTWHDMTRQDMTRHDTIWHDTTRHDTTRHDMTWHDMTRQDMTWHDRKRHDMTRHDTTRHDTTRYDMTRHYMTRHDTTRHGTTTKVTQSCLTYDGRTQIRLSHARRQVNTFSSSHCGRQAVVFVVGCSWRRKEEHLSGGRVLPCATVCDLLLATEYLSNFHEIRYRCLLYKFSS
jgi:hypothetical protein